MLCALTNRQQAARAHWTRWRARKAAASQNQAPDPFEEADDANRPGQTRADIERVRRDRTSRRDNLPLMPGGLFDECRRGQRDLFN